MNGHELKARRKELKILQWHFANLLDVTASILSNWENGRTLIPPHLEQAVKNIRERSTRRKNKVVI